MDLEWTWVQPMAKSVAGALVVMQLSRSCVTKGDLVGADLGVEAGGIDSWVNVGEDLGAGWFDGWVKDGEDLGAGAEWFDGWIKVE
eukprot:2607532-Ditylum_brightwellii.AAC.1